MYKKQCVKDLPCIFANLVVIYERKGLRKCETKIPQTWRHASTKAVASRLSLYHTFFLELINLQISLESYSLCKKHYNQIISINHFYKSLLNPDQITNFNSFQNQNKRKRHSIDNSKLNTELNITSTCDFSVQFSESETSMCDFSAQFPEFKTCTYNKFECEQTTSKIQQL
ncbi:hypothetical protein RclHR1_02110003 [Rhizophagus clarus]|uniref:Uncharacterized protein n=1 Tax=Rhizophagus clarus TaxID=94130 RepID=A0A2Z6R5L6_9GLOM|nr:hypothetical protein RclHR1_02110003 [Rhizophagus clarus]GES81473.1 hypothetical protein GLOIN_2v1770734 [Rhizophagus clarus]